MSAEKSEEQKERRRKIRGTEGKKKNPSDRRKEGLR
jgi:hypothetical protein